MIFPYITFDGCCREALEFYGLVFQCEARNVMPYGDYVPEGLKDVPEKLSEYILHAEMTICGTDVTLADEVLEKVTVGSNMKFMATVPDKATAQRIYEQLAESGRIIIGPVETFYTTFHAAVTDRYGVNWNIVAEEAPCS